MHGTFWFSAMGTVLAVVALAVPVGPGSDDPALVGQAPVAARTIALTDPVIDHSSGTGSRLIIGDSLTVAARGQLRRQGFAVHARVGRQFSAAPAILRGYGLKLPRNVVAALGTNGTVTLSRCKAVVRISGAGRRVFLVTNRVSRSWQAGNNRTLRRCDRSFPPGRVRVVDWFRMSAGHGSWLAGDGVHQTSAGRAAFVRAIDRAVDLYGR